MFAVLLGLPGAYFNAGMACYLAVTVMQNGLAFELRAVARLLWPLVRAALMGAIPCAILASLLVALSPNLPMLLPLGIVLAGVLVSAVLLHRLVIAAVDAPAKWHLTIAGLTVLFVVLFSNI